ncbi:hypothetical protein D7231_32880 [Streptomyces klenkii]|uniref:Uncharacterized protein n=2 Tax=Streptomyces klenkii TaxID=1420899 RepID=A0A3B0AJK5_9ACTN|nr:hypothetical protein D7231_32880 [Streptomyces klenkii]
MLGSMISFHRPSPGLLLATAGIGLLTGAASTAYAAALPSPALPEPAHAPVIEQAVTVSCHAFGPTLFVHLPSQLSTLPSRATPELRGFPECLYGMSGEEDTDDVDSSEE